MMIVWLAGFSSLIIPIFTPILHPERDLFLNGEKMHSITTLCIFVVKVINISKRRGQSWSGGGFPFSEGPTVLSWSTDAAQSVTSTTGYWLRKPKQSIDGIGVGLRARARGENTGGTDRRKQFTKRLSDVASKYWQGTWCEKQTSVLWLNLAFLYLGSDYVIIRFFFLVKNSTFIPFQRLQA